MFVRGAAIIISILFIQVKSSKQNGTINSPNLILNRTFTFNSPANGIQGRLNLSPKNQVNNIQQSENLNLAKNIQQALNLQQATNLQNANPQQLLSLQQSSSPLTKGVQQSILMQQPVNTLPATSTIYPNNQHQIINLQPQNQNLGNLQIVQQGSDISTLPNAQLTETYVGTNLPLGPILTSVPASQASLSNSNIPSERVSVVCTENQQIPYLSPAVSPYLVDVSQITNNGPLTLSSPTISTLGNNQPSLLTILSPPQQNQPPCAVQSSVVQNPTDLQNQITIIKSVQPYTPVKLKDNNDYNPFGWLCPSGTQKSCTDDPPSINSLLASTLNKQASKSSSLKALMPLIYNLLKDRNDCDCNNHCDCKGNCSKHDGRCDNSKQNYGCQNCKSECKSKCNNDCYDEYDGRDSYESRRNNKRYGKRRKIKPESIEYDSSEELYD